eukprot:10895370-Alexandrium_andersonii.AAC.2
MGDSSLRNSAPPPGGGGDACRFMQLEAARNSLRQPLALPLRGSYRPSQTPLQKNASGAMAPGALFGGCPGGR